MVFTLISHVARWPRSKTIGISNVSPCDLGCVYIGFWLRSVGVRFSFGGSKDASLDILNTSCFCIAKLTNMIALQIRRKRFVYEYV